MNSCRLGVVVPVRACLVEAVGAWPCRTRVKRRKASGAGEPALSGEAQYLSVFLVYWRRDGREV